MPDQSNAGHPSALPDPGSAEWWAQRIVLAELVVTPPTEGDTISYLGAYLPIPPETVGPAIAALEEIGLVIRVGDVVQATSVAKYFEHLWPIKP
jgi:hypothetical protein